MGKCVGEYEIRVVARLWDSDGGECCGVVDGAFDSGGDELLGGVDMCFCVGVGEGSLEVVGTEVVAKMKELGCRLVEKGGV